MVDRERTMVYRGGTMVDREGKTVVMPKVARG